LAAGCGGNGGDNSAGTTAPTATVSAAANTAYERSYTDCASKRLIDLAHEYKSKPNKQAVAVAVGKYWANRAGGDSEAADLGRQGCIDGFPFAPQ
jgi:hypothetical protein